MTQSVDSTLAPSPSVSTWRWRLFGGSLSGKVSVGLSPKSPLAVGISALATGSATTVAAGTSGPTIAASLAEPEAAVPDPDVAVPVVVELSEPLEPQATRASARMGRAAMTGRRRMVFWSFGVAGGHRRNRWPRSRASDEDRSHRSGV